MIQEDKGEEEGAGNVPSDVLGLMNAPIDSTWGISDSTAEAWFLSTNPAVITKYGLNSTNISNVTVAIKAAGVSPVFFYAYTVNEGDGLGGFINHYKKHTIRKMAVTQQSMRQAVTRKN